MIKKYLSRLPPGPRRVVRAMIFTVQMLLFLAALFSLWPILNWIWANDRNMYWAIVKGFGAIAAVALLFLAGLDLPDD